MTLSSVYQPLASADHLAGVSSTAFKKPVLFGAAIVLAPYETDFRREHLKKHRIDDPQPTDEFVHQAADILARKDGPMPGLFLVPALKPVLKTWLRVKRFNLNLMKALLPLLQREYPQLLACREHPEFPDMARQEEPWVWGQQLGREGVFQEYQHWDLNGWPLISLCYEPSENVDGGWARFCDVNRLMAVTHKPISELAMFRQSPGLRRGTYLMLQPESILAARRNQCIRDVDPVPMPLALIHNAGLIAHGPAPFDVVDEDRSHSRRLHRAVISFYRQARETLATQELVEEQAERGHRAYDMEV